jgi:predicted acylesterase/phospholipase RssA
VASPGIVRPSSLFCATLHIGAMNTHQATREPHFGMPIDLLLSGGGYRATLFHIGVLRFLYEHRLVDAPPTTSLLSQVRYVVGVSGGSITASHFATFFPDYCAQFRNIASHLTGFTANHDIRRHVMEGRGTAAELLADLFQVKEPTFGDLGKRPHLYLLGTSFKTGGCVAFSKAGIDHYRNGQRGESALVKDGSIVTPTVLLASAMAASTAFPPFLPPVTIGPAIFRSELSQGKIGHLAGYEVADGGIRDNLGLEFYMSQLRTPEDTSVCIISDAGMLFDWDNASYSDHSIIAWFKRLQRIIDVQMGRSQGVLVGTATDSSYGYLSLANASDAPMQEDLEQKKPYNQELTNPVAECVAKTPTDLSPVTQADVYALVRLGYDVSARLAQQRTFPIEERKDIPDSDFWYAIWPSECHVLHQQRELQVSLEDRINGSATRRFNDLIDLLRHAPVASRFNAILQRPSAETCAPTPSRRRQIFWLFLTAIAMVAGATLLACSAYQYNKLDNDNERLNEENADLEARLETATVAKLAKEAEFIQCAEKAQKVQSALKAQTARAATLESDNLRLLSGIPIAPLGESAHTAGLRDIVRKVQFDIATKASDRSDVIRRLNDSIAHAGSDERDWDNEAHRLVAAMFFMQGEAYQLDLNWASATAAFKEALRHGESIVAKDPAWLPPLVVGGAPQPAPMPIGAAIAEVRSILALLTLLAAKGNVTEEVHRVVHDELAEAERSLKTVKIRDLRLRALYEVLSATCLANRDVGDAWRVLSDGEKLGGNPVFGDKDAQSRLAKLSIVGGQVLLEVRQGHRDNAVNLLKKFDQMGSSKLVSAIDQEGAIGALWVCVLRGDLVRGDSDVNEMNLVNDAIARLRRGDNCDNCNYNLACAYSRKCALLGKVAAEAETPEESGEAERAAKDLMVLSKERLLYVITRARRAPVELDVKAVATDPLLTAINRDRTVQEALNEFKWEEGLFGGVYVPAREFQMRLLTKSYPVVELPGMVWPYGL